MSASGLPTLAVRNFRFVGAFLPLPPCPPRSPRSVRASLTHLMTRPVPDFQVLKQQASEVAYITAGIYFFFLFASLGGIFYNKLRGRM